MAQGAKPLAEFVLPVLKFLSVQHQQVLGPGQVKLQVT